MRPEAAAEIGFVFLITTALALLFFYPAVADFGKVLIGNQDIKFFIWYFWHYQESIAQGESPLYADEVFFPYGISLASTPASLFAVPLYLLLPEEWNSFGKITALQVLSFVIGGLASFILLRKISGAFLPSLAGSVFYNFSVLHFEKAIHHLNYSIGMGFLPLFFFFYLEEKRPNVLLMSLSLLLIGLNESVLAIMTLFIVFLDICRRYFGHSGRQVFTPRNTVLFGAGIVLSVGLSIIIALSDLPNIILYTVPPAPFMLMMFLALGPTNAFKAEKDLGLFRKTIIASIPLSIYFLALYAQLQYQPEKDNVIANILLNAVPAENLVVPSQLTIIGSLVGGIPVYSGSGVYVGAVTAIFFVLLHFSGGLGKKELLYLELAGLMLLFSFPIIDFAGLLLPTPFIAQPLFPLLLFLRASHRFMIFSLMFMSVSMALACKRIRGQFLLVIFLAVIVAERWPASDSLLMNTAVPAFYESLSQESGDRPVFIYQPPIASVEKYYIARYHIFVNEVYFQTIHGKSISYGIVSRFPADGPGPYFESRNPQETANLAKERGFEYFVVYKKICTSAISCFSDHFVEYDQGTLESVKEAIGREFGASIYEDDRILVYRIS